MGGVVVELRALVRAERVLDRELVQAELVRQLVQLVRGGVAEVDPDDGVRTGEVVRHVREREALGLQHALAVHPGVGHRRSSNHARPPDDERVASSSEVSLRSVDATGTPR